MPTTAQFKQFADTMLNRTSSDFKQAFTIEEKVTTPDGQGGLTVTWQTFAQVDGFVKMARRGDEELTDDHIDKDWLWEFGCPHLEGVTNAMRILHDGKVFNIKSVNDMLKVDVWLRIFAEEEKAT